MASNREEKLVFNQPKLFDERRGLARVLVERLQYRLPLAIDGMDNAADRAFAAWPERIYVIAPGGRVAYKGEMGPFGFHPEEAEKALAALVGSAPVSD
jgi:hypothetical protein